MRLQVDVGASYEVPPNVVKSVIVDALKNASELSSDRPAEVRIADFGASAINYRVWFWVDDFDPDDRAQDQVRSYIYYAFRRNNITIPYPIQVEMSAEEGGVAPVRSVAEGAAIASAALFSSLSDNERAALLGVARPVRYAAGEAIVRQGQAGRSLFIVVGGESSVTLTGTNGEVARLQSGDVFGEMSLLTGEPRTATVTAATDCDLLEIDVEGFRSVVLANPSVVEHVTPWWRNGAKSSIVTVKHTPRPPRQSRCGSRCSCGFVNSCASNWALGCGPLDLGLSGLLYTDPNPLQLARACLTKNAVRLRILVRLRVAPVGGLPCRLYACGVDRHPSSQDNQARAFSSRGRRSGSLSIPPACTDKRGVRPCPDVTDAIATAIHEPLHWLRAGAGVFFLLSDDRRRVTVARAVGIQVRP